MDGRKRNLVGQIAERLRERIFAAAAGSQIGSLQDLAATLGVGIVTVQQAARILEHEGLLEVRRGPGGGYYGKRPDAAALERLMAGFLRTQPDSFNEALNITSLLFTERPRRRRAAASPRFATSWPPWRCASTTTARSTTPGSNWRSSTCCSGWSTGRCLRC